MDQRNKNIGLVELTRAETIGAALNWYLADGPTPCDALEGALKAAGAGWLRLPPPTAGASRFRQILHFEKAKIYRDLAIGRREFIGAAVKHTGADRGLISYGFSLNANAGTREKPRLVQIGALTYNTEANAYSWRFAADRMNPGETLGQYVTRCGELMPEFDPADLIFFADFARGVLDEVDIYAQAPHYDPPKMREILRVALEGTGCFPLSTRGGFWYVPAGEGESTPYDRMGQVFDAYREVSPFNRFLLLTMPRDEQSIATAAAIVEDGLFSQLGKIEGELDAISGEGMGKANQHNTRRADLAGIMGQARTYRDLLGLATTQLEERIAKAQGAIQRQIDEYTAERDRVLAELKGNSPNTEDDMDAKELREKTRANLQALRGRAGCTHAEAKAMIYAMRAIPAGKTYTTKWNDLEIALREDVALGIRVVVSRAGVELGAVTGHDQRSAQQHLRKLTSLAALD